MLTIARHRALVAYAQLNRLKGYPPTVRELSRWLGLSDNGTADHVRRLIRDGYLSKGAFNMARNTKLTEQGLKAVGMGLPTGWVARPKRCNGCEVDTFSELCPFCGLSITPAIPSGQGRRLA